MSKNYPILQYQITAPTIDELVCDYRAGDVNAAQALLKRFEPLLNKYYRLLSTGEYNPADADMCRFLSMLGKTNVARTAEIVASQLASTDREDLRAEITLAFLQTCMVSSYISGQFKFLLVRRVIGLLAQILPEAPLPENMTLEDLFGAYAPDDAPDVDIDDTWVRGETGTIFNCLTEDERLFIKLVWNDKEEPQRVCEILRISLRTFERRKVAIREKLARELNCARPA